MQQRKVDNAHVSYKASCPPGPKIPSRVMLEKCGVSHASLEMQTELGCSRERSILE